MAAAADPCARDWRIVFLGPPNSGKGTQAALLAEALAVPAISTGEMLRAAVAAGSELGGRVEAVMNRGELVADELMAEVVTDRLGQSDAERGFILDGYPRTAPQAETLAEILEASGQELDAVLFVDAPEDVLVRRGLARGRVDDREEVQRERLGVYRELTSPLIEHYGTIGVLSSISGDQPIDDVRRDILCALGLDSADPSAGGDAGS